MTPTEAIRHLGALSAFANADEVKAVGEAVKALHLYDQYKEPEYARIIRNAIECGKCGDVIESKHPHDYKACKCGGCIVDGGLERLARSGGNFIERSEWA